MIAVLTCVSLIFAAVIEKLRAQGVEFTQEPV